MVTRTFFPLQHVSVHKFPGGEQVEVGPPSVSAICKNAKLQYSSSLFCLARWARPRSDWPPLKERCWAGPDSAASCSDSNRPLLGGVAGTSGKGAVLPGVGEVLVTQRLGGSSWVSTALSTQNWLHKAESKREHGSLHHDQNASRPLSSQIQPKKGLAISIHLP